MNKRFFIIFLFSLVGFALSILSLHQFVDLRLGANQLSSSFCSISEHVDCVKVHLSSWSIVLGKPLAAWGLGFYLLMAIVAALGISGRVLAKEASRDFIMVSALAASLASMVLFYVSEFLIGALCPVCIGMYCTNFAIFATAWLMPADSIFKRFARSVSGGATLLAIWMPNSRVKGIFSRVITIFFLCIALALVIGGETFMKKYLLSRPYAQTTKSGEPTKTEQPPQTEEEAVNAAIAEYIDEWEKQQPISFNIVRNQVIAGDYTKGSETSPVKIVEFSDFECPHCQQLGAALTKLMQEFPRSFEVVHKDFPLDSTCNKYSAGMHVGSCKAAEFARCAGEQGKFWEVAEYFYDAGVPDGKTEREVLEKLLKTTDSFGLDPDALRECFSSGRQVDKIKADAELGEKLQLQGTPAVWINGKLLTTPHPDVVRAIIMKWGKIEPKK